jgi:hypothetical protein
VVEPKSTTMSKQDAHRHGILAEDEQFERTPAWERGELPETYPTGL